MHSARRSSRHVPWRYGFSIPKLRQSAFKEPLPLRSHVGATPRTIILMHGLRLTDLLLQSMNEGVHCFSQQLPPLVQVLIKALNSPQFLVLGNEVGLPDLPRRFVWQILPR